MCHFVKFNRVNKHGNGLTRITKKFYTGYSHHILYNDTQNDVTNVFRLCSNSKTNLGSQSNISDNTERKSTKFCTDNSTITIYSMAEFSWVGVPTHLQLANEISNSTRRRRTTAPAVHLVSIVIYKISWLLGYAADPVSKPYDGSQPKTLSAIENFAKVGMEIV